MNRTSEKKVPMAVTPWARENGYSPSTARLHARLNDLGSKAESESGKGTRILSPKDQRELAGILDSLTTRTRGKENTRKRG